MISKFALLTFLLLGFSHAVCADEPLVELRTDENRFVGTPVVHNEKICWLAQTDGSYEQVDLTQVSSFSRLSQRFRPDSLLTVRHALQREYGKQMDVQIEGQYVVCAPPGRGATYAKLFDGVARSFQQYFSRRGFQLSQPKYPLIAIVLPTQESFVQYCISDRVRPTQFMQGYYHPFTNRVVLYDNPELAAATRVSSLDSHIHATTNGGPRETIIHEAVHQLAYNMGLHTRTGKNPRWVVEGLAMMLENDANRGNIVLSPKKRVNEYRLKCFQQYRQQRQSTIADFVADDESLFKTETLGAYSQAWALTYFLAETRSSDYAAYLRTIMQRDPLAMEYSAEERLRDFQKNFGNDLAWIETNFLRFMDDLSE